MVGSAAVQYASDLASNAVPTLTKVEADHGQTFDPGFDGSRSSPKLAPPAKPSGMTLMLSSLVGGSFATAASTASIAARASSLRSASAFSASVILLRALPCIEFEQVGCVPGLASKQGASSRGSWTASQ